MRLNAPDTADIAARCFGSVKLYSSFVGLGQGINVNLRVGEEEVLKPHHFLSLPPREFYFMSYHGKFKGRTVDTREANLKVKYPDYLASNV